MILKKKLPRWLHYLSTICTNRFWPNSVVDYQNSCITNEWKVRISNTYNVGRYRNFGSHDFTLKKFLFYIFFFLISFQVATVSQAVCLDFFLCWHGYFSLNLLLKLGPQFDNMTAIFFCQEKVTHSSAGAYTAHSCYCPPRATLCAPARLVRY